MRNINERPVCHRAEDLVTYLYGEASEVDSRDFADHLQQCDACRVEFGVFQQVHDSILVWRNEALGSASSPAAVSAESAVGSTQFVQHKKKLSALEAVREFFSVSPLWLRGATAFAAVLLCVLGVLAISRSWSKPAPLASKEREPQYSQQRFDQAIQEQVDKKLAELAAQKAPRKVVESPTLDKVRNNENQVAVNRVPPKTQRPRGLSRQEREQLAADLRLVPRDEDELPFGLSEEPNQ
jgi:anti-sigma factor RsiW